MLHYKPYISREEFISTIQMHAFMAGLFSTSVVGLFMRKAIKKKKKTDISSKDSYLFSDRKKVNHFIHIRSEVINIPTQLQGPKRHFSSFGFGFF